jgi:ferredoxin-NADP reductase
MQEFTSETNRHYVFLADDDGLATAFPKIKDCLALPGYKHVTLLHLSSSKPNAFHQELDILQRHFPTQLFVLPRRKEPVGQAEYCQQDLEAVLNANTMQEMQFIVSGSEEFVQKAGDRLHFLGIKKFQIEEHYFTE